jgi:hypothetical protein
MRYNAYMNLDNICIEMRTKMLEDSIKKLAAKKVNGGMSKYQTTNRDSFDLLANMTFDEKEKELSRSRWAKLAGL